LAMTVSTQRQLNASRQISHRSGVESRRLACPSRLERDSDGILVLVPAAEAVLCLLKSP
jgi:hypothetical protein